MKIQVESFILVELFSEFSAVCLGGCHSECVARCVTLSVSGGCVVRCDAMLYDVSGTRRSTVKRAQRVCLSVQCRDCSNTCVCDSFVRKPDSGGWVWARGTQPRPAEKFKLPDFSLQAQKFYLFLA